MLKKCVYFLAICVNFQSKIAKFKLEVVGMGFLGIVIYFQGSH